MGRGRRREHKLRAVPLRRQLALFFVRQRRSRRLSSALPLCGRLRGWIRASSSREPGGLLSGRLRMKTRLICKLRPRVLDGPRSGLPDAGKLGFLESFDLQGAHLEHRLVHRLRKQLRGVFIDALERGTHARASLHIRRFGGAFGRRGSAGRGRLVGELGSLCAGSNTRGGALRRQRLPFDSSSCTARRAFR